MISILPGTKINLAGRDAAAHGACGMLCPVSPSPVPGVPRRTIREDSQRFLGGAEGFSRYPVMPGDR